MTSTLYDIEQRRPSAWINRAITHLSLSVDTDTLHAISILLAAKQGLAS